MRRLSIIDLAGGQQPIWNETHDVAVVMNGELYNYREVRERLTRLGHKFKTQSDTEILVHAWEEWSEEFLGEIRGMFALAIADFRKHYTSGPILFLARDPLESSRCTTRRGRKDLRLRQRCARFGQTQRRAEFFRKTR